MPNLSIREQLLLYPSNVLAAYWRGNDVSGDVLDSSGNGRNLIANGSVFYNQNGPCNKAIRTAGVDGGWSRLDGLLGNGPTLNDFTFIALVKAAAQDAKRLFSIVGLVGEIGIRSGATADGQTTGQLALDLTNDAGVREFGSSVDHAAGTVFDNTWHFVVVRVSNLGSGIRSVKFDVDGVKVLERNIPVSGSYTLTTATRLSRRPTNSFVGTFQHVALIKYGLSDADVSSLYNGTKFVLVYADGTGDFTALQTWATMISAGSIGGQRDAVCSGDVGGLTISTWSPTSTTISAAVGQSHSLDLTGAVCGSLSLAGIKNLTIDGMRGSSDWFFDAIIDGTTTSCTFKNCVGSQMLVTAGGTATDVAGSTINATWINCVQSASGVDTGDLGAGNGVTANAVFYNCYGGLDCQEGGTSSKINATITNCLGSTFHLVIARGTASVNNNLSADATATSYGGSGNLINKPLANQVIDVAANWRLKSTADAKGAGQIVASASPDALGRIRPVGTNCDIGPHEYNLPIHTRVGW